MTTTNNKSRKLDEYYQATAQRLKNYPELRARFAAAVLEQNDLICQLDQEPCAAIVQYKEKTSRASETMTQPEAYQEQIDRCHKDLYRVNRVIDQLEKILQKMDYAIATLNRDELEVLSLRFWGKETVFAPCPPRKQNREEVLRDGCGRLLVGEHPQGLKWKELEEYGYSESNARKICARAQWKIRGIIFPCRQDEGTGIIAVE